MPADRPRAMPDQRTVPATVAIDLASLDLPRLYTPTQAAEILRHLGLPEMTECALRTRAYRRQVPFHLNGHRIRFTLTDLSEIVEGQPCRPAQPSDRGTSASRTTTRSPRTSLPVASSSHETWRARTAPAVREVS